MVTSGSRWSIAQEPPIDTTVVPSLRTSVRAKGAVLAIWDILIVRYLDKELFTSQKGIVPLGQSLFAPAPKMSLISPFACVFLAATAQAVEVSNLPPAQGIWVVSLTEENDKFSIKNKDRYYTQGLKISVNTSEHTFFSVTQEINTPSDTTNPNPPLTEMPYSGALYFGYGYGRILDRGGRRDCMFSLEAKVGVIGPSAGGGNIQNKFHDLIGQPQTAGWGTQIPDELVLNMDGEFRRRFTLDVTDNGRSDLIARAVMELGTLRAEVLFGAQYRYGTNLNQSWGHNYIRHSTGYDPVTTLTLKEESARFGYWVFADTQLEVVVRNYATDGTNFRESRSVTRTPIVLQCAFGVSVQWDAWSAAYFMAARTKDFETQDGMHFFGGLKAEIRF